MEDKILSTGEAADYIGVAEPTLRYWRWAERHGFPQVGPVGFRIGQKLVKYRKSDLDAWLAAQRAADMEQVREARELAIA